MALRITCITKSGGDHENPHIAISTLGWEDDTTYKTGTSTRLAMYDFVNDGGIAYVQDAKGNKAYLVAMVSPKGTKYVKTRADGTTTDNLLSLKECK